MARTPEEKKSGLALNQHGLKHGHRRGDFTSRTYRSWKGMLERCRNVTIKHYCKYGGRGIRVCERWLKFENFLADMGECPKKHSLDRINNDGNYEPTNCRWATYKEQENNRSNNVRLEHMGMSMTISQWAEYLGVRKNTLYSRFYKGLPTHLVLDPRVANRLDNLKMGAH